MKRTVCVLLVFDVLSVWAVFDTWRTSSWALRKNSYDADRENAKEKFGYPYKDVKENGGYSDGFSITGKSFNIYGLT